MHITSIYDKEGKEVNRLEIDDDLTHCGGRAVSYTHLTLPTKA